MNIPNRIEYVLLYVKIIKERLLFILDVKYKTTFVLFAFLLVFLVNSSADASEDTSPKVNWQLIFLSPYGGCTNYQYQMTNFYNEVTMKYFQLYQFPNANYQPICMPAEKYSKYKFPEDVDLLILVYDYEIGRKDLNNNDLGGAYIHNGDDRTKNHVIIFCDCPNFKFSDPTWILSHELSHFILYYLNYDKSIVEDKIHAMDKKYDYCTEVIYDNACSSVTTHLRGDHYFSRVTVMAPYIPAIGKSIDMQQYSKIQVSPHIIDIQKKVTKWWLDGKINDTEYAQVLAYSVNEQSGVIKLGNYSSDDKAIVFPDGPDGKEINETYYDVKKAWGKDKVSVVFGKIPSKDNMLSDNSQIFPDWFKARAQWWIQGKIWNDSEFLSSAKYLLSGNSTVK